MSILLKSCSPLRQHYYHLGILVIWLVPRAGKMNQIARCDWLPERARWSHLARSGLPTVSRKQNFTKSHIINPLLTSLFGQDGWILASFFFCEFMDLDFVSVHKHAKKEFGQYPAILTSHLVNNPYILNHLPINQLDSDKIKSINHRSRVGFECKSFDKAKNSFTPDMGTVKYLIVPFSYRLGEFHT